MVSYRLYYISAVSAHCQENLVLNSSQTGFPNPLESDHGWGGSSYPWEILDGQQDCPRGWACGLAFCGGVSHWCGETGGIRQATINFGTPVSFDTVVVWWYRIQDTPQTTSLSYWDDTTGAWVPINVTRNCPTSSPTNIYRDEYSFDMLTSSKVQVSFDNTKLNIAGSQMEHGWIYEFEVFAPETSVSVEASKDIIGLDRIADTPIFDVFGGDVFTYTVKVENPFEQAVYVMVSDVLDTYLEYVLDSLMVNGDSAGNSAFASGDLLYTDYLLDVGETLSLAFDVQVQDAAPVGWMFENVACLTAYLDPLDIPGTTLAEVEAIAPQGQVVPEPSTFLLLGIGFLGLVRLYRHRFNPYCK